MRQKVLYTSSSPQPGETAGVGEFQIAETPDSTVSSGVHSPAENQAGQMCRCDARNGETVEETAAVAGLSRLSRIAIALPLLLIKLYQLTLSPYLGRCCRFTPSCSRYSAEAFKKHGFWRGLFLTIYRLLRCNPLCRGGYDPVPECFGKRKLGKKM